MGPVLRALGGLGFGLLLALSANAQAPELTDARRIEIAARLRESTVTILGRHGGGSGVVVGEERWIVTNAHVVERMRRPMVRFGNGAVLPAEVIAFDPATDLAVLRTPVPSPAPPMPLGDSDAVQVGQTVLAYGSPFGLEGTLTQGIVSARRDLPGLIGGGVQGLIQTDAPINPGNSGGPLVDTRGEVVGINTAILSRTGGSLGIGFAIPSRYVRALLARVRAVLARAAPPEVHGPAGSVPPDRGPRVLEVHPSARTAPASALPLAVWLGIYGDDRPGGGVRVRQVVPGGPAHRAGLRGYADPPPAEIAAIGIPWTGHVIVAVDGEPVRTMNELRQRLSRHRPGQRAVLTVTVDRTQLRGRAVVELVAAPGAQGTPARP
ncbi:MAG: trypsin-like peptidase domain-containing protein [Myxococcota bacterium]|nr:trypsin-like peptidase domain-containing protein [Myxococcota bacterium]MDW8360989.1 trypsin-like peptidase domain-containing protein [Myxococcales bacterium]